ncbi:fimbrial protein [Salmonella enterica subsp. enterica serovar Gaminara]|nr:fimbrial protein [Salmonella enterica subsp. enterica serovar Gaminara]
MIRKSQQAVGVIAGMLLFSSSLRATDIPVTITVTILEPVCTVTDTAGNSQTEVNFGTVPVTGVNSTDAIRDLDMEVSCDGGAPSGKTLKMQVSAGTGGTITYAGNLVLGTSLSGLGIQLTNSAGQAVTPGTWTAVTDVTTPADAPTGEVKLKAGLVSDTASALKGGDFTSSASVVMAYQ